MARASPATSSSPPGSTDGQMLEIALVDVSGKGRNAGTRSLLLSGAMGGLLGEMSEHGFLSSANNHLQRLRWPEGFATAVHLAIHLESGAFTIGYAGHPAAVQFSAGSGQWRMLSGGRGPLLGVIDHAEFPRECGMLRRGDALVLYSDGVIETKDKTLVDGIDRMLGRAEASITKGFDGLAQRLCDHAAAGHGDDRAVRHHLAQLSPVAAPPAQRMSSSLPSSPSSPSLSFCWAVSTWPAC